MEATFFIANPKQAAGVLQYDDIPTEVIGESIPISSPRALVALAAAVSGEPQGPLQPLRDATCQSYPIFCFAGKIVRALASLKDGEIDPLAARWFEDAGWDEGEVDLHELGEFLQELRSGLAGVRDLGDRLFILLEEKAW